MSEPQPDFECRRCGECCRWTGHVLLTDQDISRLAEAFRVTETEFIDRYTDLASNRAQLTLKDHPDGACILLSGSACSVYAARPDQCRGFPYEWKIDGGCQAICSNGKQTA